MSKLRLHLALRTIWRHTAAVVAVLLIALAFILGLRLGDRDEASTNVVADNSSTHERNGEVQMYTCSMHPSVRLSDPDAKCPICFMDLIPVRDGGESDDTDGLVLSSSETDAARIETTPVVRHAPTNTLRLYGKIRTDETTIEHISAYFPGRIEKLYANFDGARISAGDHLAQMYSPDLLAAFDELHYASRSAAQSQSASEIIRKTTRETLDAARDKLRLYGIAPELIGEIERDGFDRDTFTIDANRSGIITGISVREGEYVQTGQPLMAIADLSHLWLDLQAYESQLGQIRWGQEVRFGVESYPGETFEGRVSFVDPMIDPQTRTVAVRVAVENPDMLLKPGMFASATILVTLGDRGAIIGDELLGRWVCPMHPTVIRDEPGTCSICGMDLVPSESLRPQTDIHEQAASDPLVVPASAVLFTGKRSIVYTQIIEEDGERYTPVEVTLGARAGDLYIVLDGLREGERVVTHGAFRVDSAMQIAAKPSMMMRSGEQDQAGALLMFAMQLDEVFTAYLDAQEALADDDLARFNEQAGRLRDALAAVKTVGIQGDDLALWRRAANDLQMSDPLEDIESARARFERMSGAMFALIDRFGQPTGAPLYVAHCPMAFDFRGADWLQRTQTIDNPYFGESMLQCGEITREVEPMTHEDHQRPAVAPVHQHGGQ